MIPIIVPSESLINNSILSKSEGKHALDGRVPSHYVLVVDHFEVHHRLVLLVRRTSPLYLDLSQMFIHLNHNLCLADKVHAVLLSLLSPHYVLDLKSWMGRSQQKSRIWIGDFSL